MCMVRACVCFVDRVHPLKSVTRIRLLLLLLPLLFVAALAAAAAAAVAVAVVVVALFGICFPELVDEICASFACVQRLHIEVCFSVCIF